MDIYTVYLFNAKNEGIYLVVNISKYKVVPVQMLHITRFTTDFT